MVTPTQHNTAGSQESSSSPSPPSLPSSFRSPSFLLSHIHDCLAFYTPRCVDPRGGFYHSYRNDGSIYDADTRHIVSSMRFVILFCWAYELEQDTQYISLIQHGLTFLRQHHWVKKTGGYRWTLNMKDLMQYREADERNFSYAFAFSVLTYATVLKSAIAGIDQEQVKKDLESTCRIWDEHLWEEQYGLYADEATADWSSVNPYRGQNCNMHACEAYIAVYEATKQEKYLHRAQLIAEKMCLRQTLPVLTATGLELIYEHYNSDWSAVDLEYNKDRPKDVFKSVQYWQQTSMRLIHQIAHCTAHID